MTDEELAAYIASNPECGAVPVPDGWNGIASLPTGGREIEFLRADGTTYTMPRPSHAAFLMDRVAVIGWRQYRAEASDAGIR